MADILSSQARPQEDATITVRIIKSFKFRTERSLVLHHLNLKTTTVAQLKELAKSAIATQPGWKPYRTVSLDPDTLKLYTKAHGSKTSNLIINLDHDDWILNDEEKPLSELGFENETEVSFFNREDYEAFKLNPETSWDV
ncbi:hypothetical protein D9613_002813 [Agrocybe pediades]|uniref:Cytoplasmic protein n=1 Tax=Agrocybe pediades TaxID=84607 RepID=A0A8H4VLA4_9AGAR|nr:hypothetical protein D9613_002813 [Agrocybe pediades]KAF9562127.1 cytoplasmic protein [Agrocybe pediades]